MQAIPVQPLCGSVWPGGQMGAHGVLFVQVVPQTGSMHVAPPHKEVAQEQLGVQFRMPAHFPPQPSSQSLPIGVEAAQVQSGIQGGGDCSRKLPYRRYRRMDRYCKEHYLNHNIHRSDNHYK